MSLSIMKNYGLEARLQTRKQQGNQPFCLLREGLSRKPSTSSDISAMRLKILAAANIEFSELMCWFKLYRSIMLGYCYLNDNKVFGHRMDIPMQCYMWRLPRRLFSTVSLKYSLSSSGKGFYLEQRLADTRKACI